MSPAPRACPGPNWRWPPPTTSSGHCDPRVKARTPSSPTGAQARVLVESAPSLRLRGSGIRREPDWIVVIRPWPERHDIRMNVAGSIGSVHGASNCEPEVHLSRWAGPDALPCSRLLETTGPAQHQYAAVGPACAKGSRPKWSSGSMQPTTTLGRSTISLMRSSARMRARA